MSKELGLPFDPIDRAGELWQQVWSASPSASATMRVATSIMRVQQILLARYDEALRPYGLTFARYEALVLLRFSRRGALPLKVVGHRLMVHPTSVTNTIDRLEAAGLVERMPNPSDGRGVLAAITPEGRQVVEKATADLMAIDFALDVLDDAALEQVFGSLRVVRLAAGDFVDPTPGP